jgi:hypothetical protein
MYETAQIWLLADGWCLVRCPARPLYSSFGLSRSAAAACHQQSSRRICVEHAIAELKQWRSMQRWTIVIAASSPSLTAVDAVLPREFVNVDPSGPAGLQPVEKLADVGSVGGDRRLLDLARAG